MARRRQAQSDFITNLVLLLGRGLWAVISWPFRFWWGKPSTQLDRAFFQSHWSQIERSAAASDGPHRAQAIVEADKLLDRALRQLGLAGENFADRLRAGEARFSHETYQGLWQAHKLRNQIAHEVGYQISGSQASIAMSYFRRGLQALGAL